MKRAAMRVDDKGRMQIPKEVREELGIRKGGERHDRRGKGNDRAGRTNLRQAGDGGEIQLQDDHPRTSKPEKICRERAAEAGIVRRWSLLIETDVFLAALNPIDPANSAARKVGEQESLLLSPFSLLEVSLLSRAGKLEIPDYGRFARDFHFAGREVSLDAQ